MESGVEKTLHKYLPKLRVKKEAQFNIKNMPLLYKSMYGFEKLIINEAPCLVIIVKDKNLGPREFKKHAQIIKDKIDLLQIWFMQELHYHKIESMIENEMNFIVEDKQVYLPMFNIVLKPEIGPIRVSSARLNGLAINMLIRQILKADLSGKNKLELARVFNVTQMTIGRAIEGIIAHNLCSEKKEVVSKFVHFKERKELWKYLNKNISSPVREVMYVNQKKTTLPFSGITALAKKSMLTEDEMPTFAVNKKTFNNIYFQKDAVLEAFATSKLEIWDREPLLLEKNIINALDIYLVLKGDADDRVQIELKKLLLKNNLELE